MLALVSSLHASPGLPFVRSYSLNEVGAPRGARLGFDALGRVAVFSGQVFTVLNDNTWVPLIDGHARVPRLFDVSWDRDDRYFYGALGSWGLVEMSAGRPPSLHPLRPDTFPQWVRATDFTQILRTPSGILFAGYNGAVLESMGDGQRKFFEIPEIDIVFLLGGKVYVSSYARGLMTLDLDSGELGVVDPNVVVDEVAAIDDTRVLFLASTIA